MGNSVHVPEEVLVILFSLLPAYSLMRFKCVSKAWCSLIRSLIKNPDFVTKHLHNMNSKASSASLLFKKPCPHPKTSYGLKISSLAWLSDGIDNDPVHSVVEDLDFPRCGDKRSTWAGWELAYHCDGILCLIKKNGMEVMLCNPALKESRLLPKSSNWRNNSLLLKGFGYNPSAKDYEFVRLFHYPEPHAEFYSLSSDYWRRFDVVGDILECDIDMEESMSGCQHDFMSWKGVCYWPRENYNEDIQIVSFDMAHKVFRIIELPDEVFQAAERPNARKEWSFTVWNGSFGVYACDRERVSGDPPLSIELWVMSDYFEGVITNFGDWKWTKQLVIGPLAGVERPLKRFFTIGDELLIEGENDKFRSYNLCAQRIRNVDVTGTLDVPICYYVSTLLPVDLRPENLERRRRMQQREPQKRKRRQLY